MTIPANVTKLVIEPFLETGKGKVWFDDMSLEEYNGVTGITLIKAHFQWLRGFGVASSNVRSCECAGQNGDLEFNESKCGNCG